MKTKSFSPASVTPEASWVGFSPVSALAGVSFAVSGVEGHANASATDSHGKVRGRISDKARRDSRYQARPDCNYSTHNEQVTPTRFSLRKQVETVAESVCADEMNAGQSGVTVGRDRQTLGYWCNGSTRVAAKTMEAAVKRESVQFRHTLSFLIASAYSLSPRPMEAPGRRGELVSRFGHAGSGEMPHALTNLIGSVKNGDGQNTPAVMPEFRELSVKTGKRCAIAQLEHLVKSTLSYRPVIQFSAQFAKRLENVVRHVRFYAMARFGWIPFAFASVALGDPWHGTDLNRMNHANALFSALSQVESGDRDRAIGPKGEVTRYQILPAVWKRFGGGTNPVEPVSALRVAELVMRPRVNSFIKTQGRPPSAREWYLLWHCPARVMSPRKSDTQKAERFANLVK